MNVAWRFLLSPEGKIYFVAIDLLATPAELLMLARRARRLGWLYCWPGDWAALG